jgi:hypothetical protein
LLQLWRLESSIVEEIMSVWIWQHDERTENDNKIILNSVGKLVKNKYEKEVRKGQT